MKNIAPFAKKLRWKKKRRSRVSHQKAKDLLRELMVSAAHLANLVKLKAAEIESARAQKKVMHTVLAQPELKNVKIPLAPIPYLEKNGNAKEKNR